MWDKLAQIDKHFEELNEQMARPEVASDPVQLQRLARERASIEGVVNYYRQYMGISRELEKTKGMLDDSPDQEMTALVKQEITSLNAKKEQLLEKLKLALIPKDASDDRDIIVEIRAGTGGEEAALFAADLFRMYSRYAQRMGWGVEVINTSESGVGGFREIIFEIDGRGAFSKLKYERGVHRVQRIPVTESSGRIHTSTATVAVLPKAEEVDISVSPDDLRFDIFHSGGAGGQNVNKVATAVRITHLPTGIVVICQDERSQLRNKTKALAVLRARLLDIEQRKQDDSLAQQRRSQVGSGERAEKIRTYNFPQDRLTDHRLNQNRHNLPAILDGDINELINALTTDDQAKKLEAQGV